MKNFKIKELERWLKTSLKNKVSINDKTVIKYLMSGIIGAFMMTSPVISYGWGTEGATLTDRYGKGYGLGPTDGVSIAIGQGALAKDGHDPNDAKKGKSSIAIGNKAKAEGFQNGSSSSIAIGDSATSKGWSISIGESAKSDESGISLGFSASSGKIGVSLGREAISGDEAVALGYNSRATQWRAIAIGKNSHTERVDGIAIGTDTQSFWESVALGNKAKATIDGGIALGSNSITTRDKGIEGYNPNSSNNKDLNTATWTATDAALSIGNDSTKTRQITGLAAGTNDTDAVNVAQLKDVVNKLDSLGKVSASTSAGTVVYTNENGDKVVKAKDGKWYKASDVKDGVANAGAAEVKNDEVRLSLVNEDGTTTKASILSNVGKGKVSEDSTDAINGSQLHSFGSNIAKALGGGAKFENGVLTNPTYKIKGDGTTSQDYTNVGAALTALDNAISKVNSNISNSNLSYKANGAGDKKTTLTKGLNFTNTDNITASVEDNGVVKHTLNKDLKNIDSIQSKNNGTKLTLGENELSLNDKKISGIKEGDLSKNSTDAVTGSQLFKTNERVDKLEKSVDGLGKGVISDTDPNNDKTVTGKTVYEYVEGKIKDTNSKIKEIANGQAGTVVYTNKNGDKVVKTKDGKWYKASDVKDGVANAGATEVKNDEVRLSLVNEDGTTTKASILSNVGKGKVSEDSTDAINGSQLHSFGSDIAKALGGGAKFENGVLTDPTYKIKGNGTTAQNYTNVGAALTALDNAITDVSSNIGKSNLSYKANGTGDKKTTLTNGLNFTNTDNITASVEDNGVVKHTLNKELKNIESIRNTDTGTKLTLKENELSLNGKKISGIKEGDLSKTSTDAVTGSQLFKTNERVKKLEDSVDGLGKGVISDTDPNNDKTVTGKTVYEYVEGKIKDTNSKIKEIANGQAGTVVYTNENGDRLVKGADNKYYLPNQLQKNGMPKQGETPVTNIKNSLVNADGTTTNATVLSNVGKGKVSEDSTDAVNGSQLHSVDKKVDDAVSKLNKGLTFGADNASEKQELGSTLKINKGDTSSDYKGKNLETKYEKDANGNGKITIGFKDKPEFSEIKVGDASNKVTIGAGTITGLKDLDDSSDSSSAVNKKYVDNKLTNYYDKKEINNKFDNYYDKGTVDKKLGTLGQTAQKALGGVANAVAMANLVQVNSYSRHRHNLSAAYGYYGGSHALAIGFSGTNEERNFIYKLSGSVNNKGNLAFGVGAGVMLGEEHDGNVDTPSHVKEQLIKSEKERQLMKTALINQEKQIKDLYRIIGELQEQLKKKH